MLQGVRPQIGQYSWGARTVTLGLTVGIGVAYFLAARLGLTLLTNPEDVAVFWPASGLSAGLLVAFGPRLRRPVAGGVVGATIAANLLGDRNLWSGISFALCNASEALLVAWLLTRWFPQPFRFERLDRVLGFLAAAAIGAAVPAIGAAVALRLFHNSASLIDTWRVWALSDGMGILTVAPVLIELGPTLREPPSWRETCEGILALAALAALAAFILTLPSQAWLAFEPIAILFPLLLWIAGRCRPVFAAAAVFIIAFGLVWTTTFGLGSFGDPAIPIGERVLAAQTAMVITTLCALVLVALFAERRDNEAALRGSKHRLQLALDGAELGIWEVDPTTGRFSSDVRHRRIHGYPVDSPPATLAAAQAFVDARDLPDLEAAIAAALDSDLGFKAEYRLARPPGDASARQGRWVAAEGAVIRDALGRPVRMLGVTRDITSSKQAETALRDSEGRLRDALTAGRVMAFEWEASTRCSQRSANAAEILGDEASKEGPTSSRTFLTRIHRDDRERFKARVSGVTPDQPFYAVSFRYRRPDGREVWLEETARAEFDGAGRLVSVKGLTRDVTAQRQAEEHQKLLIAELDHRVKNALSRVAAVIRRTRQSSGSLDAFVATLDGRIQSMANAHELLSRSRWQGVRLADLVARELAPYAAANNTVLDGPDVTLTATATQTLAMVLHELTTNAAKYGALSVASGRVSVRWATPPQPDGATVLVLDWQESGGPRPASTTRPGYGTSVIRQLLPHQLGGTVDLAYAADGMHCHIELPLAPVPATDPSVGVSDQDTTPSEVTC